jgi:MerR family mercuric resistance operon transcriptional regulator
MTHISPTDFSIGKLSDRTGVNIETIRYYERIGLIVPPPRTPGGHRVYSEDHLGKLVFVRRGRELGFSLGDIRALLSMLDGGYACGEMRNLALEHADDIRLKIEDLQRMESTLRATAALCRGGDAPDCPIVDALFCESDAGSR